ncbi:MAG: hypothetical protein WA970_08685 [Gammaproteobacteria bacterium]
MHDRAGLEACFPLMLGLVEFHLGFYALGLGRLKRGARLLFHCGRDGVGLHRGLAPRGAEDLFQKDLWGLGCWREGCDVTGLWWATGGAVPWRGRPG